MAASASIPASISAQAASNPAASKGASAPLAPEMVEEYSSSGTGAGNLKKVKRKSPRIRGSCSAGNVEKRPQQQQQQPLQPQQPVKEALSPSVAESIRAVFAAFVWHEGIVFFHVFYFRKKILNTVYSLSEALILASINPTYDNRLVFD